MIIVLDIKKRYVSISMFMTAIKNKINKPDRVNSYKKIPDPLSTDARKLNLIVIDDNEKDILLVKECLDFQKINLIEPFKESDKFLKYIENYSTSTLSQQAIPDLVLLDINMPKIDGFMLLKQIRASNTFKHLPVIMFSSSQSDEDIMKSYQLGANSYICKPNSLKELRKTIDQLFTYWVRVASLPGVDYKMTQFNKPRNSLQNFN